MAIVVRTIAELRDAVARWRAAGQSVALVPTMGALHEGHLSLVKLAQTRAERTVMSLFVNPTQFAPHEDFDAYPRHEATDVSAFAAIGGDLVFAPSVEEMYPEGFATRISVEGPGLGLEQAFRPTHFDGVALVVTKLLLAAGADCAVFGEKDYQQLQVIRRLATDLNIATEIVGAPIMRDAAGLALSSRNAYLSAAGLDIARQLNMVMHLTIARLQTQPDRMEAILAEARESLIGKGFERIDYLEARSESLDAWSPMKPGRLLAAAWVGRTRLIDNMEIAPA